MLKTHTRTWTPLQAGQWTGQSTSQSGPRRAEERISERIGDVKELFAILSSLGGKISYSAPLQHEQLFRLSPWPVCHLFHRLVFVPFIPHKPRHNKRILTAAAKNNLLCLPVYGGTRAWKCPHMRCVSACVCVSSQWVCAIECKHRVCQLWWHLFTHVCVLDCV